MSCFYYRKQALNPGILGGQYAPEYPILAYKKNNMDIESFRDYCLSLKAVTEEFPFDEVTLVFKIMGKMFALTGLDESFRINLKCEPEKAIMLREHYSCVIPGYHMNKSHWNTVIIDGSIGDDLIKEWIDDSYKLVVAKLPLKVQKELKLP
ncbi:MmcQ/YjbR family DNA-binding protein [Bacteroidota bacterium]